MRQGEPARLGSGLLAERLLEATRPFRERPLLGLCAAIGVFAVALLVRFALGLAIGLHLPFITFVPAIIVAPLLGGIFAGLVVTILSAAAIWLFFLDGSYASALNWPASFIVFGCLAVTVVLLIGLMNGLALKFEQLIEERERSDHLFAELRHRVANNLQMAEGVLALGERDAADPDTAQAAFQDARRRLGIMARLHRRLYDPQSVDVSAAAYLDEVCVDLFAAAGRDEVTWSFKAPPEIRLSQDRLLTVSLIVSECVTNTLKHAFEPGEPGRIAMALAEDGSDLLLTITDNGRGIAPESGAATGQLGMRILANLAKQLGGSPKWQSGEGTTFTLRFPHEIAKM